MLTGKKVLVIGLARSGKAAVKLLQKLNATITINEGKELEKIEGYQEYLDAGIEIIAGGHPDELFERDFDFVVKNPGINYHKPFILRLKERGIPVYTEIELAYQVAKKQHYIAVTGTNGKTTTVTLIYEILKAQYEHVHFAGNIGKPLCDVVLENNLLEEENHYIVHSGGIVYVDGENSNQPAGFSEDTTLVSDTVELLNDEIIFELKLPTNNYRVEKMSLYAANENFVLKEATELGSLGITLIDEEKFVPFLFTHEPDDNYNSRNITVTKEKDRLVVNGQFLRNTSFNVILYQGLKANYYNVKISKRPYTALCVDIFTEEENENGIVVTKYINADGLNGKYSIFLEIDGVIYDPDLFVEF